MILDRTPWKSYVQSKLSAYYEEIAKHRVERFLEAFDPAPQQRLLVLGLGDGKLTLSVAEQVRTDDVTGIDNDLSMLSTFPQRKSRILAMESDLNQPFPLPSSAFDVIGCDQAIERLHDVDNFVEQIFRVLKPGGYAVIFTENLSAWHHLTALTFGQQPRWNHAHVFTLQGLSNLFEQNGFVVERKYGAGYFPLPNAIGEYADKIDPTHAYFIGVKVRKPLQTIS